jgi:hypothetical protein
MPDVDGFDLGVMRDYNDSEFSPRVATRSVGNVPTVRTGVGDRNSELPSGNGLRLSCREALSAIV